MPRSTGCALCIKRRIKVRYSLLFQSLRTKSLSLSLFILAKNHQCDEGKPACANCKKYGTDCPGYDKSLKFVVGKTHRSRRQQRTYLKQQKDSSLSPLSASPTPSITPSLPSLPSFSPIDFSPTEEKSLIDFQDFRLSTKQEPQIPQIPDHPYFEVPYFSEPSIYSHIPSPSSYQAQCLSVLVDHLPRHNANSDILIMAHWMSFLPSQFGRRKLLDAAITCFTTQQIGTTQKDRRMLEYGHTTYIQALGRLQKAINSPREAASSETLCAAMLLCIYEVSLQFANF